MEVGECVLTSNELTTTSVTLQNNFIKFSIWCCKICSYKLIKSSNYRLIKLFGLLNHKTEKFIYIF